MKQSTFDAGPLADVTIEEADGRWTLVFTRDLAHAPARVWAALTDPDQLQQWSPYTADRNLDAVGAATLTMIDGATTEDLAATVERAEAPSLLEYTWGDDRLRWELQPVDRGTRLTLRHTVADRDWLAKAAAGWHLCLVVAAALLDGRTVGPVRGEDAMNYGWQDLYDAYADRLDLTG